MASRFATSATRRLSLCSGLRSTNCPLGRGIGSRAQFLGRLAKATEDNMRDNTRIEGAMPMSKQHYEPYSDTVGNYWAPSPCVSEKKCASLSPCLQHWKADISPKPKPDIFVNNLDKDFRQYFAAYSLEEDGTISPKYHVYPPSYVAKDYGFTRGSSNGLFHFHNPMLGHVLWNPTTSEYKILPKPDVELPPRLTYYYQSCGMWYDNGFEDYKVLYLVMADLEDEDGHLLDLSYQFDLYSLKTNSWRRIPCTQFCNIENYLCGCVYGAFYFIASQNNTPVILSFDFSTETFSSLPIPNVGEHSYHFLEYKGLLGVLECWLDEHHVPCKYTLWVMSDGSWTRESVFHTRGVRQPLWFSHDGELLYFSSMNFELVVFDRATGKLKLLGVNSSSRKPMMIPFIESFVQLNGISEKHEQEKEEKEEEELVIEGPLIPA